MPFPSELDQADKDILDAMDDERRRTTRNYYQGVLDNWEERVVQARLVIDYLDKANEQSSQVKS